MVQKISSFFFHELQLIIVLLLICDSYELKHKKLCVGFSIFDSVLFLSKFIFLFNNMHGIFDFKTSQFLLKIKEIEKPHTVLLPDFWSSGCNRKFHYLHELGLPKTWPSDYFLKK